MSLTSPGRAIELRDQVQVGRAYYQNGEFKKAIAHFERAIKTDPSNAEAYLWLGKSHAILAEINGPLLSTRGMATARFYLSKAVELAPGNVEYRRELFDFLVQSGCSRSTLHQAQAVLRTVREGDADYPYMRIQLTEQFDECSSPELRAVTFIGFVPRQLVQKTDFRTQLRDRKPESKIATGPKSHDSAATPETAATTP